MKGNDYNFNLCEACIIQENQNFSDKLEKNADATPVSNRQKPVFGEGGEGRSGYEGFTEGGNEKERVSSTMVKL